MRKSGSRRLSGSGVGRRAKRLGSGARSAIRTLDQKRSGVAETWRSPRWEGQHNLTNSKLAKAIKGMLGQKSSHSSA